MTMNRRTALKGMTLGAGATLFPFLESSLLAADGAPPKRVVFFMQNHGFLPHPRSTGNHHDQSAHCSTASRTSI